MRSWEVENVRNFFSMEEVGSFVLVNLYVLEVVVE